MTPFEIGSHVICIDNQSLNGEGALYGLQLHTVYTIRDIGTGMFLGGEMVGISLEEIFLPLDENDDEMLFPGYRFRPLRKLTVDDFMGVSEDA